MSKIAMTENASAPATPSAGSVLLYPKSDGLFYSKDDTGAEILISKPNNDLNKITLDEGVAPGTPAANKVVIYPLADGLIYAKDDAGVIYPLSMIRPAFSAHKNAVNQSMASAGTFSIVTWSTELFDTHNYFASNRFTPLVAGYYMLNAQIRWEAMVDQTQHGIAIYKNGVEYHRGMNMLASGAGVQSANVQALANANGTTDYFEVFAFQVSGVAQNITGTAAISYFEGIRIA